MTVVNYFGDVFTDVVLMESFLMEAGFGTKAVNYFGDVFANVVLMESFLMETFVSARML